MLPLEIRTSNTTKLRFMGTGSTNLFKWFTKSDSKQGNIFLPLGFWTHKFYLMWTHHHMMVVD